MFPGLRKIVDVRGCFWHLHDCPRGRVTPATNAAFWRAKRSSTVRRDEQNVARLKLLGWRVLVIWECQTKTGDALRKRLERFLRGP